MQAAEIAAWTATCWANSLYSVFVKNVFFCFPQRPCTCKSGAYPAAAAAAACPTQTLRSREVYCTLLRCCCAAVGIRCVWRTRCSVLYQHTLTRQQQQHFGCSVALGINNIASATNHCTLHEHCHPSVQEDLNITGTKLPERGTAHRRYFFCDKTTDGYPLIKFGLRKKLYQQVIHIRRLILYAMCTIPPGASSRQSKIFHVR